MALLVAGITFFPILPAQPLQTGSLLFWMAWTLVTTGMLAEKPLHAVLARWRLQSRLRDAYGENNGPLAAALAIKNRHEERALMILESMAAEHKKHAQKPSQKEIGLTALASVSWMARQRPGRTLSCLHQPFPQLHALVFSYSALRVQIRYPALARELADVSSEELDALAHQYTELLDELVLALRERHRPFSEEAEELLLFATGRAFIIAAPERFVAWWNLFRPVVVRGGGAMLVALRLFQREAYAETSVLMKRLSQDGLLSEQADTLQRAATFMSLFTQPQWHMTSADIPNYFRNGHYHMAVEMGVLRFPTAELPEVIQACRDGKMLRESKKRLIEDILALWATLGDELGPQMALLLKKLTESQGRQCPVRLNYWRQHWAERRDNFEKNIELLMDGIAASANGRLQLAQRNFTEVARLDPTCSLAAVNQVYIYLLRGKVEQARELSAEIETRFPKDSTALIALGRMFVTRVEDTAEAERLFIKALEVSDPKTEALLCLGDVKLMEGFYMEAQAYFDHARQVDPSLPDAKLGLARVYMETKRYEHAIEHLNSVVAENRSDARDLANYLLYRTYREMGHDKRAVQCLDKVPASFFKEPDLLDDIAVHLESEKQYAKAREFAERAMILRAGGQANDDRDALGAM